MKCLHRDGKEIIFFVKREGDISMIYAMKISKMSCHVDVDVYLEQK